MSAMVDTSPIGTPPVDTSRLAVVAIGRNEGDRLRRCLDSVIGRAALVVYVDSGSSDGSLQLARQRGAEIVELDLATPFTAARARNAGWQRALERLPSLEFVQFVDGDCEVDPAWLGRALQFLRADPSIAAVAGLRRERHPDRSIYNLACDIEWNGPPGETQAIGGDSMMRITALQAAGGFDARLIAGEEPELCLRLRRLGWRIWRLADPMTLHDAAIHRFSQWWRRTMRAGYAFALGAHLHGSSPERHYIVERRRAWIWGAVLPLLAAVAGLMISPVAAVLVLAAYPIQWLRLRQRSAGAMPRPGVQALLLVVGKFAELAGQLKFMWNRATGSQARLIEYK